MRMTPRKNTEGHDFSRFSVDSHRFLVKTAQQAAENHDMPLGRYSGILIQHHRNGIMTVTYRLPDKPE